MLKEFSTFFTLVLFSTFSFFLVCTASDASFETLLLLFCLTVLPCCLCRCHFSGFDMTAVCRKLWEKKQSAPAVRYHGLINEGATCYLNSVLQVLFMTEDFRRAVNNNPSIDHINCHLNDLFEKLLTGTSNSCGIIKALDIDDVSEQHDAAEYYEQILKLTSPEAAKVFRGELMNRTTCFSCQTKIDRSEPFWLFPLSVSSCSGAFSVETGVHDYFKTTYFSEENLIYCEHCDSKVEGSHNFIVKHLPDVLVLLLKRFDFSYHHMSYVKINCGVDVPSSLIIPEDETYQLYAVIDHYGDLKGGHYTSTIKCPYDNRWYKFDDSFVTPDYTFTVPNSKPSTSASLLFYKRKDKGNGCLSSFQELATTSCNNSDQISDLDESEDDSGREKTSNIDKNTMFVYTQLKREIVIPRIGVPLRLQDSDGYGSLNYGEKVRGNGDVSDHLKQSERVYLRERAVAQNEMERIENDQNSKKGNKTESFLGSWWCKKDENTPTHVLQDKPWLKSSIENEGTVKEDDYKSTLVSCNGLYPKLPVIELVNAQEEGPRRKRSNSEHLYLEPLQEEEEKSLKTDSDDVFILNLTRRASEVIRESPGRTTAETKPELVQTQSRVELDECSEIRTEQESVDGQTQEAYPGEKQSANYVISFDHQPEAEREQTENQSTEEFKNSWMGNSQAVSELGAIIRKKMGQLRLIVVEEETRDFHKNGKRLIIKIIEEAFYSSIQRFLKHKEQSTECDLMMIQGSSFQV